MLRILMALIMLILIGCDGKAPTTAQKDREINNKKIVESCISQGGIPIMSIWDPSILKDCIFKPK
jgi:hypothetical protein